jgi:hypothetical protein
MTTCTTHLALLAVVLTIGSSIQLAGHHGTNIAYDRTKQFTKQAVVIRFEYKNPHPQLYVDIKDDRGATESWALELLSNPAQLIRTGWSRQRSMEVLKAGTPVVVTIAPPKAGGLVGLLVRLTNIQGEEILTGGGRGGQGNPVAAR